MSSYFSPKFFAGNRTRLQKAVKQAGPIVVAANGLLQRGGDSTFHFAQDAYFWYLCGLDEPDLTLVIDDDETYLIVPPRDASRTAFDGAVDYRELLDRSGADQAYEEKAGWARLTKRLKVAKQVSTLSPPPAYLARYGFYTNPARARLIRRLKAAQRNMEFHDVTKQLVAQRMIKQPSELAAIRRAIAITANALEAVTQPGQLAGYRFEYELEADLTQAFRRAGASGHAFEPIVAAGARACTLHNVANVGPLTPGELIVLDVGAEVEHYAADITRTVANGAVSPREQAIHEAVAAVQRQAFAYLEPGVLLREYEQQVEIWMGEQLRHLGLIKRANHAAIRKYYPHATSHFVGLNVHDVGDYELPLAAGMVLTVEPGIYIPKEGIGVRIEDDVLITDSGIEILTDGLPRTLGARVTGEDKNAHGTI